MVEPDRDHVERDIHTDLAAAGLLEDWASRSQRNQRGYADRLADGERVRVEAEGVLGDTPSSLRVWRALSRTAQREVPVYVAEVSDAPVGAEGFSRCRGFWRRTIRNSEHLAGIAPARE